MLLATGGSVVVLSVVAGAAWYWDPIREVPFYPVLVGVIFSICATTVLVWLARHLGFAVFRVLISAVIAFLLFAYVATLTLYLF